MKYGKMISFAGGILMGTAGIAVLSGREAKKAYTFTTAAVLRGKDCIMNKVFTVKENCEDIYADAMDINDKIYEEEMAAELENAKAIVEQYDDVCEEESCEDEE